jgi:uncharacterized protein (TIGR00255 family)
LKVKSRTPTKARIGLWQLATDNWQLDMIRSMTGYSRVRSEEGDFTLAVSVKCTNHRFLDLQLRFSPGLEPFEPLLRRVIKDHIARGHVEVQVGLDRAGSPQLQLDRKLLSAYLAAVQDMRQEFGFSSEPDLVALLRVPGIVTASNGEVAAEELTHVQKVLEHVAGQALDRLNEMRVREGEVLERDIRTRLGRLANFAASISRLAENMPSLYRSRLARRIQQVWDSPEHPELDAGRLAQEVAFLAARSDITEELTRFRSHLDQAQHLLEEGSEVGKKLDFLLQEMNREANTLLAKTTDVPEVGLEITRQAIEMKAEIEKLREQAQNIE